MVTFEPYGTMDRSGDTSRPMDDLCSSPVHIAAAVRVRTS